MISYSHENFDTKSMSAGFYAKAKKNVVNEQDEMKKYLKLLYKYIREYAHVDDKKIRVVLLE